MAHTTARLTRFGRRLVVDRIEVLGWPVAHAAEAAAVLVRPHIGGWADGVRMAKPGLEDRSSRPS